MRKSFGPKPILYPQPVFIISAYDKDGKANAMNAAWGGLSEVHEIFMCLSPEHKTVQNILETKAFTVSMGTASQMTACDYVGIVSGNDVPDKLEKAGFHTSKALHVDAPLIDELPMSLECSLISYDTESCRLIGQIVDISVDEDVLDQDGKIDPEKLEPITYDPVHRTYRKLGEIAGRAFSDGNALKESKKP